MITTGVDIVKISRIRKILEGKREDFYKKIFTKTEIKYIENRNHNYNTVAGLFAAKEAISKSIGTGIGQLGWKDIQITHGEKGNPIVGFSNGGWKIVKGRGIQEVKLSISHEEEYAIAFALGIGQNEKTIEIPLEIKNILPKRNIDSHKGSYGKVGVIGGSIGMTGSIYLTTMGTLKSGAGLVYSLVPKSLHTILENKSIEPIIKPIEDNGKGYFTKNSNNDIFEAIKGINILAIGPGMGTDMERIQLVGEILQSFKGPVVLDADGINCVAKNPDILLRDGITIITPHPGELGNLIGKTTEEIQKNRIYYSRSISKKYNIITLLKGYETVVCYGDKLYINTTGNPGMATAGSGDVLTGIVAGLLAQNIDAYDAAKLGVYIHGLAGDISRDDKGEYGLIASDILNNIPYAFKRIYESME